jgi:hypothetical protein
MAMESRKAIYRESLEEDAMIFELFAKKLDMTAEQQEQDGHPFVAAMFRRISRQSRDESLKYHAKMATLDLN